MTEPTTPSGSARRRRADADRSVAAILDAALDALAGDPDASMSAIARRAGVVRATVYAHFPTREVLLDAVMHHAIVAVADAIRATEPDRGRAAEAFERLLRATWKELDRFHGLVAVNTARLSAEELHRRHVPVIELMAPLVARGQADGTFRADLPVAWHLSMTLAIVHAASGEVREGRIAEHEAETAMVETVLAALGPVR